MLWLLEAVDDHFAAPPYLFFHYYFYGTTTTPTTAETTYYDNRPLIRWRRRATGTQMNLILATTMLLGYLCGSRGPSGFGSKSTAAEVADAFNDRIKDKVFVVTGCSSGIGKEATLQLAKRGGIVVMACRNPQKMKQAANDIRSAAPGAQLYELPLELGSMASIREFVTKYKALGLPALYCLINNAGVMACPLSYTSDGFETQIGSNHFGHFLLTNLLVDELKKGQPSRVVNLASTAHTMAYPEGIRLDDLEGKKFYQEWGAYGQSKLANILHAQELDRKFKEKGLKITAHSLHPGVISTELSRHLPFPFGTGFSVAANIFGKSIPQGAATTVYSALSPSLEGGKYYSDCNESETRHPSFTTNPKLAQQLWAKSVELTNSDLI